MKDLKKIFHHISYLQYPLLLLALYYCYKPLFGNIEMLWIDINKGLVFIGLGVSFSTLQDTTKTQNNFSKRIFQNPTYASWLLLVIVMQIVIFLSLGLFSMFAASDKSIQELSFGFIALSIGLVGMLKSAVEMADYHRKKLKEEGVV